MQLLFKAHHWYLSEKKFFNPPGNIKINMAANAPRTCMTTPMLGIEMARMRVRPNQTSVVMMRLIFSCRIMSSTLICQMVVQIHSKPALFEGKYYTKKEEISITPSMVLNSFNLPKWGLMNCSEILIANPPNRGNRVSFWILLKLLASGRQRLKENVYLKTNCMIRWKKKTTGKQHGR